MPDKNFMMNGAARFANLANWPNAEPIMFCLATELIPELCGIPYDYFFRDDPVACAEATLLVQEYLGMDVLLGNLDLYNFESESIGAKVRFYPDHCPDLDRSDYFVKGPEDLEKIKFRGLESGRYPFLLKFLEAYKKYTGVDTFPAQCAPWTMACNLYGVDNLVMETIEDPEFVVEFLNKIVDDLHIPLFRALAEVCPGFHTMAFGDAFASIPVVTVDIVKKFIKPNLQRLKDNLGIPGIKLQDTAFFGVSLLSGQDLQDYNDFIVWANDQYFCCDPDTPIMTPQVAREIANSYGVPLQLGLSAAQVEFGSIEETVAIIKNYILEGKKGPTPLFFFFNNLTPFTSEEKLLCATAAVRTFGAPGADENTEFVKPEIISFVDFLREKIKDNPAGYTFDFLKKSKYAYLLNE